MSLSIGIVGLPNVGKSTLFNALTKNNVLAANYPFATIEPNVGVVGVPDPRLEVLAKIFSSEKIIPAAVSFVDIAGIVKGASEGAGLSMQHNAVQNRTHRVLANTEVQDATGFRAGPLVSRPLRRNKRLRGGNGSHVGLSEVG